MHTGGHLTPSVFGRYLNPISTGGGGIVYPPWPWHMAWQSKVFGKNMEIHAGLDLYLGLLIKVPFKNFDNI